jgi:hypothetical protein
MKNSLISIYLILINIMMILPFESESAETYQEEGINFLNVEPASYRKDININNFKVKSSYNGDVIVYFIISDPYFQSAGFYGERLIFETPVKMKNDFNRIDPFTISTVFNENEIKYLRKYLSNYKSVYMRYPEGLVGSKHRFGSDINLYDLLNAIKVAKALEAAKVAEQEASYQDSKTVNKLKDFFGIDR